jgi:hypothetical protein
MKRPPGSYPALESIEIAALEARSPICEWASATHPKPRHQAKESAQRCSLQQPYKQSGAGSSLEPPVACESWSVAVGLLMATAILGRRRNEGFGELEPAVALISNLDGGRSPSHSKARRRILTLYLRLRVDGVGRRRQPLPQGRRNGYSRKPDQAFGQICGRYLGLPKALRALRSPRGSFPLGQGASGRCPRTLSDITANAPGGWPIRT